jgi:hypothetical protein
MMLVIEKRTQSYLDNLELLNLSLLKKAFQAL